MTRTQLLNIFKTIGLDYDKLNEEINRGRKSNYNSVYMIKTYEDVFKQEDYMYVAEDYEGKTHYGYIEVDKPWYSPRNGWKYSIRVQQYYGNYGGSGWEEFTVKEETIRPCCYFEKILEDINRGWRVTIVKDVL